jgi:hypothetical protein
MRAWVSKLSIGKSECLDVFDIYSPIEREGILLWP